MPTRSKLLTDKELKAFEAGRDIGSEIVQSLREAKAGKTRVVYSPSYPPRQNSVLSQTDIVRPFGESARNYPVTF
jgi:putative transcriptional regulator